MSNSYDVLVVGDATIDLIFTGLPHLPALGEDTLAKGFKMVPGEGYTPATALHRLGVKTAWAANFGNDWISDIILTHAREEQLDERFFVFHNQPFQRISVSASLDQERGFLSYYDPEPGLPAAAAALAKINARVLLVPGLYYGPLFDVLLPVIKLKKMTLVMDGNCNTGINLTNQSVKKAIKSSQIFLPNQKEALSLTGCESSIDALKQLGELCPLVVMKAGKDGSYAIKSGEIIHEPAIELVSLDTTGAGDCFNAGFLKAWLDGKNLSECLKWGNITGGLSALGFGGTGQKVTLEMIYQYLNK